jgi:hypothetical protein
MQNRDSNNRQSVSESAFDEAGRVQVDSCVFCLEQSFSPAEFTAAATLPLLI